MFEELVSILTFKHSQDPIEQNKKGQLSQGRLHGTIFNGATSKHDNQGQHGNGKVCTWIRGIQDIISKVSFMNTQKGAQEKVGYLENCPFSHYTNSKIISTQAYSCIVKLGWLPTHRMRVRGVWIDHSWDPITQNKNGKLSQASIFP